MENIHGMPLLGFGTFPLKGDEAKAHVLMALELGYRHIDTAQMYGNEAEVGRALSESGLKRSEVFVVTKIDPGNLGPGRFERSLADSLKALNGPPDLLLMHWPPPDTELDAVIDRLVAAHAAGHAKAVGISNSTPAMMRRAQGRAGGLLSCNQVEFHPLIDQARVLAEATAQGLMLAAYCPIGRGAALKPGIITGIGKRLGRPPSEIVLRWIVQQGVAAIPMTTKRENARSNLRVFEFELDSQDMTLISSLGTKGNRLINPPWMAGRWDD